MPVRLLRTPVLAAAAVSTVAALWPVGVVSQQRELPGPDAFLDLNLRTVTSDNLEGLERPSGRSTILSTDVILGFDSATRTDEFSARLGANYEGGDYADDPDGGGRTNPFATVEYTRETKQTALSFSALVRERDNGFNEFSDATTGTDLIIDQGTRRDHRFSLSYEIGRSAPFGLTATVDYNAREFNDTSDASLTDQDVIAYSVSGRLNLNRTNALTFGSSYSERDEDGGANSFERRESYFIGLNSQIRPDLRLTMRLAHAVNVLEETVSGNRTEDREDSPTAFFSLEQDRPNGLIGATFRSELLSTGLQSTVSLRRQLELQSGSLDATAGLTRTPGGEVEGIGRLAWTQDLRRGRLRVDFTQSTNTNDDNEDSLNSLLNVSYDRPLTDTSSVTFRFAAAQSDVIADNGIDTRRNTFGFTYRHQLTEDWNFNAGYDFSSFRETGQNEITENRFFAGVGRRFSLRP